MTKATETTVLDLAMLNLEAVATGEACILGDYNEARFRAATLAGMATRFGFPAIATAAKAVSVALGPSDGAPLPDYAAAINGLSLLMDPTG